jgi:hypothetical protein
VVSRKWVYAVIEKKKEEKKENGHATRNGSVTSWDAEASSY